MILEEISLRNWRSYREPHNFRFSPGLNLLTGPNEAGKSTVFEALSRGLFDRHTSKAREIRAVRPLGSSLGPEVRMTMVVGSERIRICKRFLSQPYSRLLHDRGGDFELEHEGDRADVVVRQLLRGGEARGVSKPQHRGWAQALWYLQRDEALPRREWDRAVKDGLQGLAHVALRSPAESRILAAVEKTYHLFYTPTGKVAARGVLGEVEDEVERLERELKETEGQLHRRRVLGTELEDLYRRQDDVEARLLATSTELEALEPVLAEGRARSQRQEELERSLAAAIAVRDQLQRRSREVSRRQKEIAKLGHRLQGLQTRLERLQRTTATGKREAHQHDRRLGREIEPGLLKLEPEIAELQAIDRLEELRRKERQIGGEVEQRKAARRRVDDLEKELHRIKAPAEEEWRTIEEAARRVQLLEFRRRGARVKVSFKLHDPDLLVKADPPLQPTAPGPVYELDRSTNFRIGELAQVRVSAGETEIEAEVAVEQKALDLALQHFDCEDIEILSALHRERRRLEAKLLVRRSILEDLEHRDSGGEALLRVVRAELSSLEGRLPQPLLPGMQDWTSERRKLRLSELEEQKESLRRVLREEREAQHDAQTRYLTGIDEMRKLESEEGDLGARLAAHRAEVRAMLGKDEQESSLALEAESAKSAVRDTRRQLAGRRRRQEEKTIHRAQKLEQRKRRLQEDAAQIRQQIADRVSRRDELEKLGLPGRIGDFETRLEGRRRRRRTLARRAAGARLLREMIVAYQDGGEEELSEPVQQCLSRWWCRLSDGAYDSVQVDSRLIPGSARSTFYGEPLAFSSLSYGSCEQIIVLLRLAIGVALSVSERQLVIFDDRLVNADPARMQRFCRILEDAAQHCQILVATCDAALYSTLEAQRVVVPDDGLAMAPPA